jgi:hypothetical protein
VRHSGFSLCCLHQPSPVTFARTYGTIIIPQVADFVTKNGAGVANERIEKLLAKREEVNAKIRRELGRDRSLKRRQDTRRKILAGALVLAEKDPAITAWLARTVAKLLTREDERALFGLAPLPAQPSAPQKPDKPERGGHRPQA